MPNSAARLALAAVFGHKTITVGASSDQIRDYRGAARLLREIVDDDPGNVSARLLLARSHFHAARLTRAYDECMVLLAQDPTEPYARLLMARTCERLNKPVEARAHRRLLAIMSGDDGVFGE